MPLSQPSILLILGGAIAVLWLILKKISRYRTWSVIGLTIAVLSGLFILFSNYPVVYNRFNDYEQLEIILEELDTLPKNLDFPDDSTLSWEGGGIAPYGEGLGLKHEGGTFFVGTHTFANILYPERSTLVKDIIKKNRPDLPTDFETVEVKLIVAHVKKDGEPYYSEKALFLKIEDEYIYVTTLENFKEWIKNYRRDYFLSWGIKGIILGFILQLFSEISGEEKPKKEKEPDLAKPLSKKEKEPDLAKAWTKKGNALEKSGRLEDALKAYEKAIKLRPDYAKAWYNKSCVLILLNSDKEGIKESFKKAVELDKKYLIKWETDPDFESIKNEKWFIDFINSFKSS